ncbi:hypothetical protein [Paenibacillus etheri]|uniref:DUF4367 domain-containing protein n=1 Tax=Paenibacillus etheri TaxID=1306852 RepID=A0A0W1AQC4_9BACL|nr:hypothetical protein [Paenibacillus etheri]KTD83532.1 hypothetical protein UQ64_01400 [Paenibacillus etheri]
MKPNDLSQQADMIHKIKDLMNMTNLPEQDFSDTVMMQIKQLESIPTNPRKTLVITMKRLAIAICVIGLLSGFSYVANEWFNLRDKAGNPVMEVRSTNSKIPDWQTKILEQVKKQIAPGESAVVYFGSKEEITKQTTDQILWTTSPIKYRDHNAFIDAVQGPLANSRLFVQVPDGYEFEAGYIYMDYQPQSPEDNLQTFVETETGKEYAYGLRKAGSGIQSVTMNYKKGKDEIAYQVNFLRGVEKSKFFITKPSKDLITDVWGTDTYYDDHTLNWVERSEGGFMNYSLSGSAATKEQLVEFAKVILAH